jgi:hypothetical protein
MEEIIIYNAPDDSVEVRVQFDGQTVWLTQSEMGELFEQTKQNISLHINNCFREGELNANSVVKDSLTTASDGKKYKTKSYNLDVIISVGYRVKSKRGTQFRIWANNVLKDYLVKGYAVNEKRLHESQQQLQEFEKGAELKKKIIRNFESFYESENVE